MYLAKVSKYRVEERKRSRVKLKLDSAIGKGARTIVRAWASSSGWLGGNGIVRACLCREMRVKTCCVIGNGGAGIDGSSSWISEGVRVVRVKEGREGGRVHRAGL